jgi:oxygen-independent coproporphyrinogen-3 oxidase
LAGIYIHIPFCKQACFYCDFHFSVNQRNRSEIVQAILTELAMQKGFFVQPTTIQSIYFGGGTPSILSEQEISLILDKIFEVFTVDANAEITFECNPDDLTDQKLNSLKQLGINRLSIGIQSFEENILKWMNRSHNAKEAYDCTLKAAEVGFKNLTIDLIYGIPQLSTQTWELTIEKALGLPVNHLSCYSLTLEEHTPYKRLVEQQKYLPPDDNLATQHYTHLVDRLSHVNWDHYEVSNFCKNDNVAQHNTAYWQRKPYLGVGPSAHSFDGVKRFWNVASNKEYLAAIRNNSSFTECETLSTKDVVNEILMTGLRTKWGVDKEVLNKLNYTLNQETIALFQAKKWLTVDNTKYRLTEEGFLYADYIASELFLV